MNTTTSYIGLTADNAREIATSFYNWQAEFPDVEPGDAAAVEFLEDVHIFAIDMLDIDSLHPDAVVAFNSTTAAAITAMREEHRAAYADYGVDVEMEDFDGFERFMDAQSALGEAIVDAACQIASRELAAA